jgi:hypothetical protein
MRKPSDTWFDHVNRYRLAAAVLVIPAMLTIISMDLDLVTIPSLTRRVIYWLGLAILLTAVAMDKREVYRGRQDVEKLIKRRLRTEHTSQNTTEETK